MLGFGVGQTGRGAGLTGAVGQMFDQDRMMFWAEQSFKYKPVQHSIGTADPKFIGFF